MLCRTAGRVGDMLHSMNSPTPQARTGKRVHIAVYLDADDAAILDRYATENSRSRSGAGAYLLLAALRMFNATERN
jgi:hypothetical protein